MIINLTPILPHIWKMRGYFVQLSMFWIAKLLQMMNFVDQFNHRDKNVKLTPHPPHIWKSMPYFAHESMIYSEKHHKNKHIKIITIKIFTWPPTSPLIRKMWKIINTNHHRHKNIVQNIIDLNAVVHANYIALYWCYRCSFRWYNRLFINKNRSCLLLIIIALQVLF